MKFGNTTRFLLPVFASILGTGSVLAEPSKLPVDTKKPVSGIKPMVKVKHASLYKNSHILSYRGEHAIIPKRSILFLPEKLKSRVAEKPAGKFVLWPFFKQRNQTWIWTYEITLDQAKGIKPLPKGKIEQFQKLNRIVVAQFRGNPISVLPPAEKDGEKKDKDVAKQAQ